MGNVQFNIAAGRTVELAHRVNNNDPTNSAFIIVALKSAGLQSDALLVAHDTLAAVLAASNDEATNVGYSRLTVTTLTVAVDDANGWVTLDMADPAWASVAAAGGAWGALLACYDSDTTGGTDSDIVPLLKWDFARTPNGGAISAVVPSDGFFLQRANPS